MKRLFAGVILLVFAVFAHGDLYKWQDNDGQWHFGDAPEPGKVAKVEKSIPLNSEYEDLKQQLLQDVSPNSPVDEAVMAAVTIKTTLGQGVGFFVNDEGYLVTLLSVVRPKPAHGVGEKLDNFEAEVEMHATEAKKLKVIVDEREQRVNELKKLRTKKSGDERKKVSISLKEAQAALREIKAQYNRVNAKARTARQAREQWIRQQNIKNSRAKIDAQFRAVLQNGQEKMLDLVTISNSHGLALLRLPGYHTPHVIIEDDYKLSFGQKLFVVGGVGSAGVELKEVSVAQKLRDLFIVNQSVSPKALGGMVMDSEGLVIGMVRDNLSSVQASVMPIRNAIEAFPNHVW